MILLRQREFADKLPKNEKELHELLKKKGDEAFNRGLEKGCEEGRAQAIDERIKERARRQADIRKKKQLKENFRKFIKSKKGKALIGAGIVSAGGALVYSGIKDYKKLKKTEKIRKQVSGYDSSKAKKK